MFNAGKLYALLWKNRIFCLLDNEGRGLILAPPFEYARFISGIDEILITVGIKLPGLY